MCERFQQCPAVDEAVRRMLELLSGYRRGDVVPWAVIEGRIGFARYTEHWAATWHRARRDFREAAGIVLWPVRDKGAELLTVHDTLHRRSIARHRRAVKQLTKDIRELAALPDAELNLHQRLLKANKIARSRLERRNVLHGLRIGHKLSKPTASGVPRVRPPLALPEHQP